MKNKYWNDRRAAGVMLETANLYAELGDFAHAEQLQLQNLNIQKKHLSLTDPNLIGHEAAIFVFYSKAGRHESALHVANELKEICDKGTSFQRRSGFPYIVLLLSHSMVHNWFDVAAVLAEIGRSILSKDYSLKEASEVEKFNWSKDIGRLEAVTGKSFH